MGSQLKKAIEPLLGIAITAAVLAASRTSEAIDLLRFPLAWVGVLICLDGLVRAKHGRSPLARWSDWTWSLAASVAFWDLFELVNLRLQNWWYTGASRSFAAGAIFSALSFATVLPAVRLCQALVSPRSPPPAPRAVRSDFLKRDVRVALLLTAIGVSSLALALAFPRVCFPLAWLFIWPLCEAALIALGPVPASATRSPLESWRAGDRLPALQLLACGIPLGLVWEGLNWGCARGWVYTVPHFESHKLFEMPLAGFLGYPPFLLEAGAVLALVDRLRLKLRAEPLFARRSAAVLALFTALIGFHLACDFVARTHTVISFASQLDEAESIRPIAPALERGWNVRTPRDLLAAAAKSENLRAFALGAGLRDSDLPQLELALRECGLAEQTGMGLSWAEILGRAGADSLNALARADTDALFAKVSALQKSEGGKPPDAMLIRLWAARARAAEGSF